MAQGSSCSSLSGSFRCSGKHVLLRAHPGLQAPLGIRQRAWPARRGTSGGSRLQRACCGILISPHRTQRSTPSKSSPTSTNRPNTPWPAPLHACRVAAQQPPLLLNHLGSIQLSQAASWRLHGVSRNGDSPASVSGATSDVSSGAVDGGPPSALTSLPAGKAVDEGLYEAWDRATDSLATWSTLPNLLFLMPQILKNAGSLLEGHPAELAGLSWVAFTTGYLGNMLCLSYFSEKKELSGFLVQTLGATGTVVVLTQLRLADIMPSGPHAAVVGYYLVGVLVNALRYTDNLPRGVWRVWVDLVGILGLAVFPQVLWSTFSTSETNIPGAVTALVGVACIFSIRTGTAPPALVDTWQKLSGWTATALFMLMPVTQLTACIVNPANLATLSPISYLLALLGNSMMVPRALFTRDLIWFLGVGWGAAVFGWATLCDLAVFDYFPMPLFLVVSAAFLAFLTAVLAANARILQLASPLASLLHLRP